jgi:hypothetical protein
MDDDFAKYRKIVVSRFAAIYLFILIFYFLVILSLLLDYNVFELFIFERPVNPGIDYILT